MLATTCVQSHYRKETYEKMSHWNRRGKERERGCRVCSLIIPFCCCLGDETLIYMYHQNVQGLSKLLSLKAERVWHDT